MRLVIGVDPGKSGALAAIDLDTLALCAIEDMPVVDGRVTPALLADFARRTGWDEIYGVAVEFVRSSPQMGVTSAFSFGYAYGVAVGFFAAHWPCAEVVPSVWKPTYHLTGKGKDASRAAAISLWPSSAALFKRVKDDGRAEAALIARHHALSLRIPQEVAR